MASETNAALVQGSAEWHAARLGKITCSRFADVLTQPRSKADREAKKMSLTATSYMLDLVAEILTGQSQEPPPNAAMRWGNENEPAARDVYSEVIEAEVQQVGFYQHPEEPMIGGSPDGLIEDAAYYFRKGGVEIKCPYNTAIHLGYMLGSVLPKDHVAQVQGHMWITGREWWDFVSYTPEIKGPDSLRLAMWRLRVERDVAFIQRLEKAVFAFRDKLLETLCTLRIKGGQS